MRSEEKLYCKQERIARNEPKEETGNFAEKGEGARTSSSCRRCRWPPPAPALELEPAARRPPRRWARQPRRRGSGPGPARARGRGREVAGAEAEQEQDEAGRGARRRAPIRLAPPAAGDSAPPPPRPSDRAPPPPLAALAAPRSAARAAWWGSPWRRSEGERAREEVRSEGEREGGHEGREANW